MREKMQNAQITYYINKLCEELKYEGAERRDGIVGRRKSETVRSLEGADIRWRRVGVH